MKSKKIKEICIAITALVAIVFIATIVMKEIDEKAYFFSSERRRQLLKERELKVEQRKQRLFERYYRRQKKVRDEWYERPEELLEAE